MLTNFSFTAISQKRTLSKLVRFQIVLIDWLIDSFCTNLLIIIHFTPTPNIRSCDLGGGRVCRFGRQFLRKRISFLVFNVPNLKMRQSFFGHQQPASRATRNNPRYNTYRRYYVRDYEKDLVMKSKHADETSEHNHQFYRRVHLNQCSYSTLFSLGARWIIEPPEAQVIDAIIRSCIPSP